MRRGEDRFRNLDVREAGGVHWVTIARPGDRNALDSETLGELGRHLEAAEAAEARAVVYRGGGETYFVGGADGVEMCAFSSTEAREFSARIQAVFLRMEESPMLLIAAINGLCFGGGLEFALACDLRVASEKARIGLPEVKLGIIPGGGGTQRLARVVGFGKAVEMILGGRLQTARESLDAGLIHELVSCAELEGRAAEMAERVKTIPAHAFAAAKRAVYASRDLPLRDGLEMEADRFAECFTKNDFADRVRQQLAEGRLQTTRLDRGERKAGEHGNVSVE